MTDRTERMEEVRSGLRELLDEAIEDQKAEDNERMLAALESIAASLEKMAKSITVTHAELQGIERQGGASRRWGL